MLSKWLPWDFSLNHPTLISKGKLGLYAFHFFDPFMERLFLSKVPRNLLEGGKFNVYLASEITPDWLEEKFQSLGLFSENDSYLILRAEELSAQSREWLLSADFSWGERYVLFSFAKDDDFFKEWQKVKSEETFFQITAPPFWDNGKLLDFLAKELRLSMTYDAKQFILETIPNQCADFIFALKMLALNLKDSREISLSLVQEHLALSKLDSFLLAEIFSSKKFEEFYLKILSLESSFDEMRGFFNFLQGHLIKLHDPSYISKKDRPSRYDKQILSCSKLWKSDELKREIQFMAEMETLCKSKSPLVKNNLHRAYLRQFL